MMPQNLLFAPNLIVDKDYCDSIFTPDNPKQQQLVQYLPNPASVKLHCMFPIFVCESTCCRLKWLFSS